MTEAPRNNAPRETRSGGHLLLAWLGRARIRHPRWTLAGMVLVLALPFLLYVSLAWVLTGSGGAESVPNGSLKLIAPDKPAQDSLAREIGAATEAERERIASLAFVVDPFPYWMPLQRTTIPPSDNFEGSDSPAVTATYANIAKLLTASGCADVAGQVEVNRVQDKLRLQQAEALLIPTQTGAQRLNLARYFYHMGLVQLCKNDMQQAYNAFHSAAETIKGFAPEPPANGAAAQYLYLSVAGERLSGAKIAADLPELPPAPTALGGDVCAPGAYKDGCPLFLWPTRRNALVELHTFLLDPNASSQSYQKALADARNGFGTISVRNYANVVVAHAKAGDFENIGSLLQQLDRFQAERDCDALGRMVNVGWISGHVDASQESLACSADLPTVDGALGNDIARMRAWTEVHSYRAALKAGNFQTLIARMRATDKEQPDTRAFLQRVRAELLSRLSNRLLVQAETLRRQGAAGAPIRESLLKLMRSEAFPLTTRLSAAITLTWGPLLFSIWWPLAITLLLLVVLLRLWDGLGGYGLMFTQRHHLEKKRNAA